MNVSQDHTGPEQLSEVVLTSNSSGKLPRRRVVVVVTFFIFAVAGLTLLIAKGGGRRSELVTGQGDGRGSGERTEETGALPGLVGIGVTGPAGILIEDGPLPRMYREDLNKDGIPDFIEKETKYDWQKDECLAKVGECAQPLLSPGAGEKPKNIVVLLDASGSMGEIVAGQTKMAAAKGALKNFAADIDIDVNVALVVFGHKGSNKVIDKAVSCAGIETAYPLGWAKSPEFNSIVEAVAPKGWTALAGAMQEAKEILSDYPSETNLVVLLTDGEETCGGDPLAAARRLKELGVKTVVDVLAFAVSSTERQQLQKIAEAGGGEFKGVNNQNEIEEIFRRRGNLLEVVSYRSCSVSQFNEYGICSLWRLLEAQDYLNNALLPKTEPDSNERQVLGNVLKWMSEEVERRKQELYKMLVKDVEEANPVPN